MAVAIKNKAAQKQSSDQTKIQTKIKVRYYEGANNIVTLYMPSGEKIKVTEYGGEWKKWLDPLIEWVKKNGMHKFELRKGYSRLARRYVTYTDNVWIAEIDADELLKLVTSHETWTRSRHAKEIVEKVSQMLKH